MGNAGKVIYSKEKDYIHVKQMLTKYPQLKEKPITKDTKQTPLMRATFNCSIDMVNFLIKEGVDVNAVSPKGQTALSYAIVKTLIQNGANPNIVNNNGLTILDYAILPGFYNIALYIYERLQKKIVKETFEYQEISKKYSYRYVNYKIFLQGIKIRLQNDQVQDYLNKPKIHLKDPVPDPRQSWGQWIKRNSQFKDAPLVQRDSLPQELQPQNRTFGKLDIFLQNWSRTQGKKKVKFNPVRKPLREVVSQMGQLNHNNMKQQQQLQKPKTQI